MLRVRCWQQGAGRLRETPAYTLCAHGNSRVSYASDPKRRHLQRAQGGCWGVRGLAAKTHGHDTPTRPARRGAAAHRGRDQKAGAREEEGCARHPPLTKAAGESKSGRQANRSSTKPRCTPIQDTRAPSHLCLLLFRRTSTLGLRWHYARVLPWRKFHVSALWGWGG